jgi:hypothetical protein
VSGVGKQRHGIGHDAEAGFCHQEDKVQRHADGESAGMAFGGGAVVVAMPPGVAVIMTASGSAVPFVMIVIIVVMVAIIVAMIVIIVAMAVIVRGRVHGWNDATHCRRRVTSSAAWSRP